MKRIMIVDDSLYTRLILRNLLLSHGYSVVAEAGGGREVVDIFSRVKPDVVIMDAAMPDMDGITATRNLKREYPEAVVILAASHGQRSAIVEGLSAGASDFVAKPYSAKRVIHTIKKTIG